jgi:hypothetical protein
MLRWFGGGHGGLGRGAGEGGRRYVPRISLFLGKFKKSDKLDYYKLIQFLNI